jgi:Zn-dependent protease/predicted transcriptional regulator
MQAQIKLGRIFGIEIGLHYSWLIIAILITLSLEAQFNATNVNWGAGVIWATAIVTSLLFFVTIVLHELSHALVAKQRGLPVRSITLFALGGVATIEKEAEEASTEFWMALVGPVTSLVIGILCFVLSFAFGLQPDAMPTTPVVAALMWLGVINIGLAIFNLVPGFPLDGGRVLRAVIWWITDDPARATRIAARIGKLVGFSFIVYGIFRFFSGAGFGALWIAFIGWFLLDAAHASYDEALPSWRFRGIRVGDLMAREFPIVDAHSNLQVFVDEHLLRTGQRCFAVAENGRLVGLVTAREVHNVARAHWKYKTVADVMHPLDKLHTISPDSPLSEALEMMVRENVNQLPVVNDGRFSGIISRGNIMRALRTRVVNV